MRIHLLSNCAKTKRAIDSAPIDLYRGDGHMLLKGAYYGALKNRHQLRWHILSAEHGWVPAEGPAIAPYDTTIQQSPFKGRHLTGCTRHHLTEPFLTADGRRPAEPFDHVLVALSDPYATVAGLRAALRTPPAAAATVWVFGDDHLVDVLARSDVPPSTILVRSSRAAAREVGIRPSIYKQWLVAGWLEHVGQGFDPATAMHDGNVKQRARKEGRIV